MKRYKQLTSEQRYQISGLRKAGLQQAQIADEVGGASLRFRVNSGGTRAE